MSRLSLEEGFSWAGFESIENDLLSIIEYIPLGTKQYKFYSFQLGDVLKNSCSQIDSLFKEISRQCDLSDHPDQSKLTEYKNNISNHLNINDHGNIFSSYYELPKMTVIIRKNYDELTPFENFTGISSPDWWGDYNKLKHDFYNNFHLATLENALNSLAALFILNYKIKEQFKHLAYNNIFLSPNLDYTDLLSYVELEPSLEKFNIIARSKIFESWVSNHDYARGIRVDFKGCGIAGEYEDFIKKFGDDWFSKFHVR